MERCNQRHNAYVHYQEPLVYQELVYESKYRVVVFQVGLCGYCLEAACASGEYRDDKKDSSLISLNRGRFDVIVGMDWLSKRKFVIVHYEKVVRIPLEGDEILRVHGERTQGVVKTLLNTKFRIDLVPEAMPVAKSPYRLTPLEMQELSEQLRELQDKGFIRPSHFPEELGSTYDTIRDMIILRIGRLLYILSRKLSKIVKPLTSLTERNQKYEWGAEREEAFQTLKNDLCDASINKM
ncbi:hypothetical protein Tco_0798970 [Tanacetum coccineum]